jgi:hypothetical protein
MSDKYTATRRSLNAVAEQVLAGPQHRAIGRIALRVTPEGFATLTDPGLRVTATRLIGAGGEFGLDGSTCAELAAAVGVAVGPPIDVYAALTGVAPDEVLVVDAEAAGQLCAALERGDSALRRLVPDQPPVLWPEHFDVGITLDEVNYGVSPGDDYLAEPYAYVGPWQPRTGEFWNAPFGACRPLRDLPGEALDEFLARGQELAAGSA